MSISWPDRSTANADMTTGGATVSCVVLLLGILVATLFWHRVDQPAPAKFVLDMTVSGITEGSYGVDLYVNSKVDQPFRTPVRSGRFRYEWPCNVTTISLLRLDPVQTRNAQAIIHSFHVESNGQVVKTFDANEFASWEKVNPGEVIQKEFHIKSDEQINHIETSNLNIRMPPPPGFNRILRLVPVAWPERFIVALLIMGLLTAGAGGRVYIALIALIVFGLVSGFSATTQIEGTPPSVAKAVGWASYVGYGKTRILYDLLVLLFVPIAASITLWKAGSRKRTTAYPDQSVSAVSLPEIASRISAVNVTLLILAIFVVFLYYLWGAAYVGTILPKLPIPPGWDVANQAVWAYALNNGKLPLRDFWYPYGDYILKEAAFPWGFLFERLYLTASLILCFLGFYFITGKSRARTLLLCVTWFALCHQIHSLNWLRYTSLVPFTLTYVAASRRNSLGVEHVAFWLSTILGLFGDIVVFAYSWFVVGIVILADFLTDKRFLLNGAYARFGREFAVPAVLVTVSCIQVIYRGQFAGYLEFFANLDAVAAYASAAADEYSWLRFSPIDSGFFLWAGGLLAGLGLFSYLTEKEVERPKSLVVFLLGLLNVLLFYKALVRPGELIFLGIAIPVAGFVLLLSGSNDPSRRLQRLTAMASFGVLLGTIVHSGAWPTFWARMKDPEITWTNITTTVSLADDSDAYVQARWDLQNFKLDPPLIAVLNEVSPELTPHKCCDLFTLSDAQFLYIMARKQPPYYVNLYDGSPLVAQKRTVAWLDENRPSVVVYESKSTDVFGVPDVVRAPLVFERIVTEYSLEKRVGDYLVLRPKPSAAPPDLAFWGGILGDIPLHSLPSVSSFRSFDECDSTPCVDFLRVSSSGQSGEAVVGVMVDGHRFQIRFSLSPEQTDYYIYLDRLWFWGGVKRFGLTPSISDYSPDLKVEIIKRAARSDILY